MEKPTEPKWIGRLRMYWEFLRRNKEYRAAYQNALQLRKREKPPYYNDDSEAEEEQKLRAKFGLSYPYMLDPEKTLDELLEEFPADGVGILTGIQPPPYESRLTDDGHLIFDIDLNHGNLPPTTRLLKDIKTVIENTLERFTEPTKRGRVEAYKQTLECGDLRRDGLSYRRIAELAFPGEEPENAKRKVRYHCKRYNELVEGGYKKLVFP